MYSQYSLSKKFVWYIKKKKRTADCVSHSIMHTLYQLLTYLLTPWGTVLVEKLTGSAASQEIPRFFGTPGFITVLTSARHLSLSWAYSIQSPQPPPTSWRSILILSSHLCLGLHNGLLPPGFPTSTTITIPRKLLCVEAHDWTVVLRISALNLMYEGAATLNGIGTYFFTVCAVIWNLFN